MRSRERYHSGIGLLREINIQLAMTHTTFHPREYHGITQSVTLWSAGPDRKSTGAIFLCDALGNTSARFMVSRPWCEDVHPGRDNR
jgi:hypothetical protein